MAGLFVHREKELLEINSKLDHMFKSSELKSIKVNTSNCVTSSTAAALSKTSKFRPPPVEHVSTKNITKNSMSEAKTSVEPAATRTDPQTSRTTASTSKPRTNPVNRSFMNSEVTIKCLKAKQLILQQELDIARKDGVLKAELLAERAVQLDKAVVDKVHTMQKHKELEVQFSDLQKKLSDMEHLLKDKNSLLCSLETRLETASKELKKMAHTNCTLEKRMNAAQTDVEHMQKNVKMAKESEANILHAQKQERNVCSAQIKQLSQQRQELIGAYKNQLLLLDNLKRQNMCLEQGKLIQVVERDFVKMLNCKQ